MERKADRAYSSDPYSPDDPGDRPTHPGPHPGFDDRGVLEAWRERAAAWDTWVDAQRRHRMATLYGLFAAGQGGLEEVREALAVLLAVELERGGQGVLGL